MHLIDVNFDSIPNKQYTVKTVILVHNRSGAVYAGMKKIATDRGCLEAAQKIVSENPGLVILYGKKAMNDNNYGSPTTVVLSTVPTFNRAANYIMSIEDFNRIKDLIFENVDAIEIGPKKTYNIRVISALEMKNMFAKYDEEQL